MPRRDLLQIRQGTAAQWAAADAAGRRLALGEPGLDTTNGIMKYGDGVTAWASLGTVPPSMVQTVKSDANIALASSAFTWIDVDLGGNAAARPLDLVLPGVQAGQGVVAGVGLRCTAGSGSELFRFVTIVAGAVVNPFNVAAGLGTTGLQVPASTTTSVAGEQAYRLAAGDISGGAVRIRLQHLNFGAASTITCDTVANGYTLDLRATGPFR